MHHEWHTGNLVPTIKAIAHEELLVFVSFRFAVFNIQQVTAITTEVYAFAGEIHGSDTAIHVVPPLVALVAPAPGDIKPLSVMATLLVGKAHGGILDTLDETSPKKPLLVGIRSSTLIHADPLIGVAVVILDAFVVVVIEPDVIVPAIALGFALFLAAAFSWRRVAASTAIVLDTEIATAWSRGWLITTTTPIFLAGTTLGATVHDAKSGCIWQRSFFRLSY